MMDGTIQNISQLEKALSKMKRPSDIPTPATTIDTSSVLTPQRSELQTPREEEDISYQSISSTQAEQFKSIPRGSTSQLSTAGLLNNIAGLETSANIKLDKLTDAIYSLQNCMERIYSEQNKQTELLATIARNTVSMSSSSSGSNSNSRKSNAKNSDIAISEYGFNTNLQLLTAFIEIVLSQIKLQAVNKSRQYRINRDLTSKEFGQVLDMAIKNKFKVGTAAGDEMKMEGHKIPAFVKVASRIGTINGVTARVNSQSLREIFDDPDCGYFVTCIEHLMNRLKVLRILLPVYEGDLIQCIEYPYFSKEGEALCKWSMLSPREETPNEKIAITAELAEKKKIAKLLAAGITEKSAISGIIRDK